MASITYSQETLSGEVIARTYRSFTITLTEGEHTSPVLDIRRFGGLGIVIEGTIPATAEIWFYVDPESTNVDGTLKDTAQTQVKIASPSAGEPYTIEADLYPWGYLVIALRDSGGTAVPVGAGNTVTIRGALKG